MACVMASDHQMGMYQTGVCQSGGYQMVLVPMPMRRVAAQQQMPMQMPVPAMDPGACYQQMRVDPGACYPQMQMVWSQPVPFACSSSDARGTCAGAASPAASSPAASPTDARSEDCLGWSSSMAREQQGSSSMARRQRRQRAVERAVERAEYAATAKATLEAAATAKVCRAMSDASTSDGESEGAARGPVAEGAVQELTRQLNAGGEVRSAAVASLTGSVWRLSQDPRGCRLVQLAIEVASSAEARALAAELHGHVVEAVNSPNANYVLQKVVEALPIPVSSFVAEELAGSARMVANHRYGCRVFCRLLEHCGAASAASVALIDECLVDAEELIRNTFGHYVAKTILEHGTAEQRRCICEALYSCPAVGRGACSNHAGHRTFGITRNAVHRNASYVMEKALESGPAEDAAALARELLSKGSVVEIAQSPSGSHVVKALLRLPEVQLQVHVALLAAVEELQRNKFGIKLLQEMGVRAERPGAERTSRFAGGFA